VILSGFNRFCTNKDLRDKEGHKLVRGSGLNPEVYEDFFLVIGDFCVGFRAFR